MPFPEAELVSDSVGFKTKSRFKTAQASRHVVNQLFAFYSWIELSAPDFGSAGGVISFGFGISAGALSGAHRLLRVVLDCVRSGGDNPLDGGRLRLAHEIRENLLLAYGSSKQAEDIAGAEFVNLDKVSLPAQAGVVPVSSLLLPLQKKVYLRPDLLLHTPEKGEVLPKPCHRVRAEDEAELQAKLFENSMGGLLLENEVATDPDGCVLSWVFAAKKPPKNGMPRQRLIFDRRRQNALEKRVRWATLPSARLLRKRVLRPSEVWRGSGKDLENFYFILLHDPVWFPRNCVGRRVPKILVAKWLGSRYLGRGTPPPSASYRLCLRVPGMGDLNTVDLTTAAHINLLREKRLPSRLGIIRAWKASP